jgi:hypothetical protein
VREDGGVSRVGLYIGLALDALGQRSQVSKAKGDVFDVDDDGVRS